MSTHPLIPILIIGCLGISCNSEGSVSEPVNPNPIMYTVTISTAPADAGTVTPSTESSYEEGTQLQIEATSSEGYSFVEWTGTVNEITNPLTITVNKDFNITANFQINSYELSVNIIGEGNITETIVQQKADYEYGTIIELSAEPSEDWEFIEWQGDLTATENPTQVVIENATEITAVFESSLFYLAANGVTVKCPEADVGDFGTVNGITYTKRIKGEITAENAATTCTSGITDLNNLFVDASNFNENISTWDVSSVTEMYHTFRDAALFNQDIGHWDVSNVTVMYSTFLGANSFNQDISDWDVGSITNMIYMFHGAISFNQNISDWDVSNVTDMKDMFHNASSFNQDLDTWDVSNVTRMVGMFQGASSFNQPIGSWDVSNVEEMRSMFEDTESFNQDISEWDVSNVFSIGRMFKNANSFNQDISSWDVSTVQYAYGMFWEASSFNQNIGTWDVSSIVQMEKMFDKATIFNQDLSDWCVEQITSEPTDFATGSALQDENKPLWGTCPN